MKKKILVVNGKGYAEAVRDLDQIAEFVFNPQEFLDDPSNFILVMFTGGSDVSPSLYGHTSPNQVCSTNPARDVEEIPIFELALENNIPMTGICRGSQFLNVMCGGIMVHHLDNHSFGSHHTMCANTLNADFEVTSTHHQMSIPSKEGNIVGWSSPKLATIFLGDKDKPFDYKGPEVESIYYPKHKVFAVQYHPEYMPKKSVGYKWYNQGVKDLLNLTTKEFTKKYVATKELNV